MNKISNDKDTHDDDDPALWEAVSAGDIFSELGPMSEKEIEYYQSL